MPKEINGYRIVEKAQGGMAVVYKGMNSSGFCRAFKVVRPDKAVNNPALCQRFLKGIQILKSLDHPNHRMNTPSAAIVRLWPGIALDLPSLPYLPIRGPRMAAPTKAIHPPTE